MSNAQACGCSAAPTLIFSCSGAADVGQIADLAARQLTRDGVGKMFCIVGVGGRVSGIMASTKAAARILAIDGCPLSCVKNCLQQAGIGGFHHLQLADLGMAKGKAPATDDRVAQAAAAGAAALAGQAVRCETPAAAARPCCE